MCKNGKFECYWKRLILLSCSTWLSLKTSSEGVDFPRIIEIALFFLFFFVSLLKLPCAFGSTTTCRYDIFWHRIQGCQIWPEVRPDYHKIWQIWNISFSNFWSNRTFLIESRWEISRAKINTCHVMCCISPSLRRKVISPTSRRCWSNWWGGWWRGAAPAHRKVWTPWAACSTAWWNTCCPRSSCMNHSRTSQRR